MAEESVCPPSCSILCTPVLDAVRITRFRIRDELSCLNNDLQDSLSSPKKEWRCRLASRRLLSPCRSQALWPLILLIIHVRLLTELLRPVAGAQQSIYIVQLYGANEVGTPGDPNAAGQAILNLNGLTGSLDYDVRLTNVEEPLNITILYGGPTDVPGTGRYDYDLSGDRSGTVIALMTHTAQVTVTGTNSYQVTGSTAVPGPLLQTIPVYATVYYLQVYTRSYPYGALRGQLQYGQTAGGGSVQGTASTAESIAGTSSTAGKESALIAGLAIGGMKALDADQIGSTEIKVLLRGRR